MRVLVVDDEENVRKGIATFLELSGHEAVLAADLAAAKAALAAGPFGAALVDVYVGRENGATLLDFASERAKRYDDVFNVLLFAPEVLGVLGVIPDGRVF